MTISHVQGTHAGADGSGSTIVLTFTNPVGTGNTVCGGFSFNSTTLTSVTDDKGNTYNTETLITSAGASCYAFSLGNITNGPKIITITLAANSGFGNTSVADEYSGTAALSDPRDVHGGQAQSSVGTTTDAVSSGSFTTTANGDLIYGVTICTNSANLCAAGTGFTGRSSDTGGGAVSEDLVQSSAGSIAATFTNSQAGDFFATFLLAIKAASGTAPAPVLTLMSSRLIQ